MDNTMDDVDWLQAAKIAFSISLFYLAANLAIMIAVFRKWIDKDADFRKLTMADFFIMLMSGSDMMSGLAYCIAIGWADGDFANSDSACIFSAFVGGIFTGTSLMSLFMLAFSRYAIVRDPLHFGLQWKTTMLSTTCVCLMAIAFGIFAISTDIIEQSPSRIYCAGGYQTASAATCINAILTLCMIVGPSIGIFYFYASVIGYVKETVNDNQLLKRLSKMCCVMSLIYVFSMFPYAIQVIHVLVTGRSLSAAFDATSIILTMVNFVSNPFLYIIYQRRYRKAVFDLLGVNYFRRKYGYIPWGAKPSYSTKNLAAKTETQCELAIISDDGDSKSKTAPQTPKSAIKVDNCEADAVKTGDEDAMSNI